MIPKIIHTAWFGEEMPPVVVKSITSQVKCAEFGYKHLIWNETQLAFENDVPEYIKIAIQNKKWVKATDYLRAWVMQKYGGVFLDADQEVLPGKSFDDLLNHHLFASREENGFIGYSLVGSESNHPLWKDYFEELKKFTPLDGKNFESSMEIFTNLMYRRERVGPYDVTILPSYYFFPYNHQTGIIDVHPQTRSFHHFMKTWTDISPDLLPTVSIIIPQLGREHGLKRLLQSIDRLYYPKHLIEVLVEEGPDTVPTKVERAYNRSKGVVLVYMANDTEFDERCLYNAVLSSKDHGLVAFNEGEVLPDEGNICTHFLVRRDLVPRLENGQIFSTGFYHVGCDNWLWAQAKKMGEAYRGEDCVITHRHFAKGENDYDEVYDKGWVHAASDRLTLTKKLSIL